LKNIWPPCRSDDIETVHVSPETTADISSKADGVKTQVDAVENGSVKAHDSTLVVPPT
jgi:hypothetical protein